MNDGQYKTIDKFDRMLGSLEGLPDVSRTKPSTSVVTVPVVGSAQTFIIQTVRQRERGDTIFIQYVDDAGSVRLFLPPAVADVIARQRDSLSAKVRREHGRRIGKEQAQLRKARGEQPAFLKGKKAKPRKEG